MANAVNRYFEGLLVGGTLGFVIGLLTAPKPGAELRRELADSADDMLKQANENWLDVKDRMSDRVQPLADKAEIYKERFSNQASNVRSKIAEKSGELKEMASERAEELKEKASSLKEKASGLKDKVADLKEKSFGGFGGGTNTVNDYGTSGTNPGDSMHPPSDNKGADLLNNYMGNNSGPMYTAGQKANPDASTMPVSDSCSNYSAGKANEGAAGS